MNESEFRDLMQSGLGRAITYARENDVGAFRDVILDACLHCYSADAQSEGTRAGYMLELVNLLPDRDFYCDEVLKALPGSGDDWDALQRFCFATDMASEGDERAKRAVYENFDPGPRMGESMASALVRMDGLEGLLFAAAKLGALLAAKPNEVDVGYLWWQSVEICGEEQVRAALLQAGKTDPHVETYRLRAEADWAKSMDHQSPWNEIQALDYEGLKARLLGLRGFWLGRWGEKANAENIELAARGLMAARTPEDQLAHLRIFSSRTLPLDHRLLLELATSPDDRLACAASRALTWITHPSVRALAFRLVEDRASSREDAIAMLAQNWEPGDHDIVLGWFEREQDRDMRHGFGIDLRKCWKRHPEPASEVRMLRALYEKGPCSFCREFLLSRLIELDSLPDDLRAECAFDANEDVRVLVGAPPASDAAGSTPDAEEPPQSGVS